MNIIGIEYKVQMKDMFFLQTYYSSLLKQVSLPLLQLYSCFILTFKPMLPGPKDCFLVRHTVSLIAHECIWDQARNRISE